MKNLKMKFYYKDKNQAEIWIRWGGISVFAVFVCCIFASLYIDNSNRR
jgi:hypothetical protein